MKNITIPEAKTQLNKILDDTVLEHEIFMVTGKYGKSVIISESNFIALTNNAEIPTIAEPIRKPPRKSIEERFKGYNGDYKPAEIDWGAPVGKEIW